IPPAVLPRTLLRPRPARLPRAARRERHSALPGGSAPLSRRSRDARTDAQYPVRPCLGPQPGGARRLVASGGVGTARLGSARKPPFSGIVSVPGRGGRRVVSSGGGSFAATGALSRRAGEASPRLAAHQPGADFPGSPGVILLLARVAQFHHLHFLAVGQDP